MIITFLIEGPIVGFLPKLAYVEGKNREGVEEVKNSLLPFPSPYACYILLHRPSLTFSPASCHDVLIREITLNTAHSHVMPKTQH